jgi:hypothetical protein
MQGGKDRPYLNLSRFAGPAASSGLSVRLSSGRLYIHAIHGCGVLGPKRKCRQRSSRHRTGEGQLPAFESESQYGVRVRPRQRAGEVRGLWMATWSEGERIEDSDLSECTNFGFETGGTCVAGAELILSLRTVHWWPQLPQIYNGHTSFTNSITPKSAFFRYFSPPEYECEQHCTIYDDASERAISLHTPILHLFPNRYATANQFRKFLPAVYDASQPLLSR